MKVYSIIGSHINVSGNFIKSIILTFYQYDRSLICDYKYNKYWKFYIVVHEI